ncbi:MAG TPA: glycosyltransferase family 39 protein [Candidatus Acidoferrales bacterium]|nr:glycosyltransferase family 39 protein [Candidatus Acidoferrales bacterium]
MNVSLAVLAGLALRVFFVLKFPVTESGDAPFYIELAWNWLKNGVYGFPVNGQLTPVDMRVPGYPAFLAAVFAFAGNSTRAVMLAQVVLDLATCFLIALIAARLAPEAARRRVALAGLWLAALCPFTANYTAVVLTETLTIFLTALAILVLLETELGKKIDAVSGIEFTRGLLNPWFLAGIVVGFGALVRPETPLLLFAAGLVLVKKWWRPVNWTKLLRAGLLLAVGTILPLVPWAARNWYTLHDVQFLAPRYSELPGEYTPLGFSDWTNTWLWHFRDVYLTQWKLNEEEIPLDDIPASAFDSPSERARISDLLDQYNEELTVGPALDQQFREIAGERTSRHPLRTYLKVPFLRALTLWFTPRIELLPYSGHLRPIRLEWEEDRHDFLTTLSLIGANFIYLGLALVGAWIARWRPGTALLIVFIILRTAFFTKFVETPEPRYVLECFPAVIALAAQVFAGRR